MIRYLIWRLLTITKYTGREIDLAVRRENVLREMDDGGVAPVTPGEIPEVVRHHEATSRWREMGLLTVMPDHTSCVSFRGDR